MNIVFFRVTEKIRSFKSCLERRKTPNIPSQIVNAFIYLSEYSFAFIYLSKNIVNAFIYLGIKIV